MKFITDGKIMKNLQKIISPDKTDVYAIRMETQKDHSQGTVKIVAFDSKREITSTFSADVIEEGMVSFTSKFFRYLSAVEGDVTVTQRQNQIIIQNHTCIFKIPLVDHENISFQKRTPVGTATFELEEIKRLFKRIMFATGTDTDYKSILLDCKDDMVAVACDRRIIGLARLLKGSPYRGSFIMHREGVSAVTKLEGDMITLTFYDKAIGFSVTGDIMCDIVIPEYALCFPKYEEVIQVKGSTFLDGEKTSFLSALDMVREVSDELTIKMVHKEYVKQKPRFLSSNEGSSIEISPDLEWRGDDLKVKLNAKSLAAAIEQAEGIVTVSLGSDCSALSITDDQNTYLAVMLPFSPAERR